MVLRIENVNKVIKGIKILSDISFSVGSGKIIGIIGHNGAGKSMLFKTICGFVIPTSGFIYVHDKQIGKDIDFAQDTGVLIEDCGFIPNITAFSNLKLLSMINKKADDKRIDDVLKTVGLRDERKAVKKFSLGMKQRLSIAQALLDNPSLLILDEPMNSLDYEAVIEMRVLFKSLKEEGKTILIASHNNDDIDELCDDVYEIDKGVLKKHS